MTVTEPHPATTDSEAAASIEALEAGAGGARPPSMLGRITLILDEFCGPAARLTLETVARRTGLPRSTTHRILDQMVQLGWLEHSEFGYVLGPRAMRLGAGDSNRHGVREAAAPLLHDLQIKTGLTVHLAVLDGVEIHYLDKVGGRFATSVPSRVGGRAPAHTTALGKAMLAWLSPEEVDSRFARTLRRPTNRSIGDLDTLHQELGRIRRRQGVAFEAGECFPTLACAAAAVRGPEGPLAAVSVVGDRQVRLENVAPLVGHVARTISQQLFPGIEAPRHVRRMGSAQEENWSEQTMEAMMAFDYTAWM